MKIRTYDVHKICAADAVATIYAYHRAEGKPRPKASSPLKQTIWIEMI